MTKYEKIALNQKEAEIVLFGIAIMGDDFERDQHGDIDPQEILLRTYTEAEIVKACAYIEDQLKYESWFIKLPLAPCAKDVLRLCVENTLLVKAYYEQSPEHRAMRQEVHQALLSLAKKLDGIGIEVNHMPGPDG